ncbi:hypothetical protein R5R35_004256 [Gryllus longicercus]|uniref:Protein transport protein Sec31A n=1 Tax=Gryllus longicercus TaxID=2509291 RepID=A0AAN9W8Z2_9ORTH
MKVKEIDRTVNVAWSPATQYPILLAAGTAAQQLDSSFSTSAALELYSLNLGEPGLDMDLRVSAPSDYRFHKIAWGAYGPAHEKGSGIIVGGCDGGRIQIYNASKLLSGEDGLIVSQEKHTGPVQALDFNPFQSNLLATGASESEIFIWDLNNVSTPMTPGAKAQPPENVVCMSWNRQVQHILASTFAQRCVVWDLRKNEPIIKLSDGTTRIRWKVVAWHPEVATQMCLASEEDQSPVIQLWDLRFATSPLKVLEGHQRGVLSIAWCMQDSELLVSCGKDNRILCWNPESSNPGGEVVCDVATTNQWNFDVSWCPRNPALIAASSFDGHVSIYSLLGGQQQMQTSNKIADSFPGMEAYAQAPVTQQHQVPVDLRKPPKWLRRPVGASFGFGGKLVIFENATAAEIAAAGGGPPMRTIRVSQVVTEPELIQRSTLLESALQSGQYVEFCQNKITLSTNPHDKYVWSFLRASFSLNPQTELLNLLGFKQEELNAKLNRLLGKPANARPDPVENLSDGVAGLGRENESGDDDGSDDLQINSGWAPDGDASAAFDAIAAENQFNNIDAKPLPPLKIPVGDDTDGLISQALLLGNIESAVDLCLNDGRMADAIILAMTGGNELLARTQYRYFQQSKGQLATLISAVVTEDWSQVVKACEVDSWKEALAATLTHAKNDEFPILCEQLGQRLEQEGHGPQRMNAQLCYICAGSVGRLVDCWSDSIKPDSPNKMQDLVERVMILSKAAEFQGHNVQISGSLAQFLSQYAGILAAQGSLNAAVTYLGNSDEEQVKQLRERLLCALGHQSAYANHLPQQCQPSQVQQQQHAQSRVQPSSRRSSAFYPAPVPQPSQHNYGGAASQPQPGYSPFQTMGQQTHVKPATPSFPGQGVQQPVVPKPYAPAPTPPISSQPFNPQPFVPAASTTQAPAVPLPSMPPASLTPTPAGGAPSSRSRPYVLDPSVQSGPAMGPYGTNPSVAPFSPTPSAAQVPTSVYQPQAAVFSQQQPQQPIGGVPYSQPGAGYGAGEPAPAPPMMPPNFAANNAPPGWNDPPTLKGTSRAQFPNIDAVQMSAEHAGTRKWKNVIAHKPKAEYQPQAPITHPIFGAVPAEAAPPVGPNMGMPMNGGYSDQSAAYSNLQQQQQIHQYNQQQQPLQQHQQQQQQPPQHSPVVKAEPAKPKGPVPEEHMYLQTVFNELRDRCMNAATNPQAKRKLEDVGRKLEVLYDALRENKLSPNTLSALHQMVQLVQTGNYTNGLHLHTQLVSGPDFSQISSFMPGLKVLLQLALQLGVYLQ